MVKTIRYRVGQFLRALTAGVADREAEQAMHVLTPEAQAVFRRQSIQDQRHALAVYDTLRQAGHTNPHLLAAAMLHDSGKAAAWLPPWQRAVIVLLDRFSPRLLARLSKGEPRGWRRSFVVHAQHPEAGAYWAHEAGCSPVTVSLIRRHHDRLESHPSPANEQDQLLAALQAADSMN